MHDVAFVKADDEVAAAFLEADHDGVVYDAPGEDCAAPCARLEHHQRCDLDIVDAALSERVNDLVAFPIAICFALDMLQRTATAGAEMFARWFGARGPGRQNLSQAGAITYNLNRDDVAGQSERDIKPLSGFAVAAMT